MILYNSKHNTIKFVMDLDKKPFAGVRWFLYDGYENTKSDYDEE